MDGKRAAEETAGGDAKRLTVTPSGPEFKVRALFRGKNIGSIIGKGGVNIRAIREGSGCRVNISDKQANVDERVVAVLGDITAVCSALDKIVGFVSEEEKNRVVKDGGDATAHELTLTLLVPSPSCGCIIGKAGASIKELQEGGAKVKVQGDQLPGSNERPVLVTGPPAVVSPTVQAIAVKLHENSLAHTASAVQEYVPGAAGGMMSPGGMAGGMMPGMGAYGMGMPGMMGMGMGMGGMGGAAAGGAAGGFGGAQQAPLLGGAPQMQMGGMGMMQAAPQMQAAPHVMTVPNDMVGTIIGKGGASIKEIRAMSGAKVQISQSTADAPQTERTITITGAPESINVAIYLVNQVMAQARQQ